MMQMNGSGDSPPTDITSRLSRSGSKTDEQPATGANGLSPKVVSKQRKASGLLAKRFREDSDPSTNNHDGKTD